MRLLPTLFASVFLLACAIEAEAQPYSALYIFGDSYCDTGNVWAASGGTLPVFPYYDGRFSNGPLWVEQLASSLQLSARAWLGGGTDYAFAGAQMLQNGVIPGVPLQVDAYLMLSGGRADSNALYVIEGGTNDVLLATSGSPTKLGSDIAARGASLEGKLRAAGATHFLMVNLPDVGLLPAAQGNSAFATETASSAKTALGNFVSAEQAGGVEIAMLDFFSFSQGIVTHAAQDGFAPGETPCLSAIGNRVCADPTGAVLWDTVHWTAAVNTLLASAAETRVLSLR